MAWKIVANLRSENGAEITREIELNTFDSPALTFTLGQQLLVSFEKDNCNIDAEVNGAWCYWAE